MVGFGYTEVPEDITDFTLDFWVSHIIGFLDALGIARASFIGNSYGGALSVAVAARHPERVARFALMGAAGLQFEMSDGLREVWGYEPSEIGRAACRARVCRSVYISVVAVSLKQTPTPDQPSYGRGMNTNE